MTVDTLRRAIPYFRKHALLGGGWDPEKGSIATYFVECCIRVFHSVVRS
ncbi:hypothetical protein [Amycolatopsis sp. NBC_01480]|nr:hypothetical protein [Amycolatopsis sp. NBC_01480]